jgi:hypothetical protein
MRQGERPPLSVRRVCRKKRYMENFTHKKTGESIFGERFEGTHATNKELDRTAVDMVATIVRAGGSEPDFGGLVVEKSRKMATLAMKADQGNIEERYRPGSRLRTYTGARNPDGTLKDETYGGEATVKEGSTIYRNSEPIQYPSDWKEEALRGKPIRGRYLSDGTFEEDPEGGAMLYNTYVTDDSEHPKRKYGIEPKPMQWIEGMAQIPSYLFEIPKGTGETEVITGDGKKISVHDGDFLVVDNLGGGKTSVQAVERGFKERTYTPWASEEEVREAA